MDNRDIEALIERSFDDDVAMIDDQAGGASSSSFRDSGFGNPTWSFSSSSPTNHTGGIHHNHSSTVDGGLSVTTGADDSISSKDIFYCKNYFDLDDILAQTIRVSVKFQRTIPKLGFLDPSSGATTVPETSQQQPVEEEQLDIAKGTKLELPLWVVKELNGDHAVTVTVPKGYNQLYREILEADANCVNLHKLGPNYYQSGQHLVGMNLPESEDVARSMLNTFTQRFHRLFNFALSGSGTKVDPTVDSIANLNAMIKSNPHSKILRQESSTGATSIQDETVADLNQFMARLDNWEKELMETGRKVVGQIKRWECRDLAKVKPNEMVLNLKKRKRLIEQHLQQQRQNMTDGEPVETTATSSETTEAAAAD